METQLRAAEEAEYKARVAQNDAYTRRLRLEKVIRSVDERRKKLFDQGMEVAEALDERAKKQKQADSTGETFDSPFNVDWSAVEIPADFAFLSDDTPAIPVDSPGNLT